MTIYSLDILLSQFGNSPLFHVQFYSCFLICIQVSQETGTVVWFSPLFKSFPQLVVIYTVKSFSIISEAEVDVFLKFPCFLHDPTNVGNLILVPLPFLNPNLHIWKFSVHVALKPSLKDFDCNLMKCKIRNEHLAWAWLYNSLNIFGVAFLLDWMKADFLQSCGHSWVFQICWHIECSTLTASSFRIWNNLAGIPSAQLAFFVVILPKAHLTSQSRVSGSRWVITPSWLSGSLRLSMYSCHVFLIFLLLLGPYHFCPLLCPSLHKMFSWSLQFSWDLSSSPFCCSPLFLCIVHFRRPYLSVLFSGTLHSVGYIFPFLPCLLLHSSAICKASSDNHFAFLHFFFLRMVLITPSCITARTSVHSSSGTLSVRSNPLNLLVTSTV